MVAGLHGPHCPIVAAQAVPAQDFEPKQGIVATLFLFTMEQFVRKVI